jgi:hypothetical protein
MLGSTQQSVPIAGVKDGIVILKTGGYRMVLEISAVNFSLKSEEEQNSLIFQYQSFLNSLNFPIEIVIRSRRLDLSPYLTRIKKLSEKSINDLVKAQIDDYVEFVAKLITIANIMKKTFYVVVPYEPINIKKLNILDTFMAKSQKFDHLKISDTDFKANVDKLKERADIVASGLGGMGLHCFQLSTEEIIELFYQIYNPDEANKERVENADSISSPVIVSKSEVSEIKTDDNTENTGSTKRGIDNSDIVHAQQKASAESRRIQEAKNPHVKPAAQQTPAAQQPVNQQPATPQIPAAAPQAPTAQPVNQQPVVAQPSQSTNNQNTSKIG